jgi:hypothetical protein
VCVCVGVCIPSLESSCSYPTKRSQRGNGSAHARRTSTGDRTYVSVENDDDDCSLSIVVFLFSFLFFRFFFFVLTILFLLVQRPRRRPVKCCSHFRNDSHNDGFPFRVLSLNSKHRNSLNGPIDTSFLWPSPHAHRLRTTTGRASDASATRAGGALSRAARTRSLARTLSLGSTSHRSTNERKTFEMFMNARIYTQEHERLEQQRSLANTYAASTPTI